jgi:hypothetical protein
MGRILIGAQIGCVLTAAVGLAVVQSDPEPCRSDPKLEQMYADEVSRLRWELFVERIERINLLAERDLLRHGIDRTRGVRPIAEPAGVQPGPDDLIPPQSLPLPSR